MDFFEKKIKEERDLLDHIEQVDEEALWRRIESARASNFEETPIRKISPKPRKWIWMVAAASVVLLLSVGYYFIQKNEIVTPVATTNEVLPPELKEEAKNFQQLISEKKENLDFEAIDQEEFKDIFYELALLEEIHQEFRSDLPEINDQEKMIKILKKYYERKIRILERLSKEIEKKSHHEKRINEKPVL